MKILLVTPRLPWPTHDGGQVCMSQHLSLLSVEHRCLLVALRNTTIPEEAAAPPVDLNLEGLDRVDEKIPSPAVSWVRSWGSAWPATLHRYRSTALANRVRDIVRTWQPDLAVAENLHLAYLCRAVPEVPWMVVEQNVESLFLERVARARPFPLRLVFALEASRMRALEPGLLASADAVASVDEREAAWIRKRAPETSVHVIPVGVSGEDVAKPEVSQGFLLLGTWQWAPNRDAAAWFLRTAWPLVRAKSPGARVTIVGRASGPSELGFAVEGAEWAGEVASVVPWLSRARALVVPLRTGAGLRVKILEAMALGTAVIATPEAVGGLELVDGTNVLIARTPGELAEAVLRLESDEALSRRMGESGRIWVRERFGLPSVKRRLERAVEDAVARGRGRLASP